LSGRPVYNAARSPTPDPNGATCSIAPSAICAAGRDCFYFYEKRPMKLFLINNDFRLISLLFMGAIVAVWV
jgi:hypothetical protein